MSETARKPEALPVVEYESLVLRIASMMVDQRPDWTLDGCVGMVRSGIKLGVSRHDAEQFEAAFVRAWELHREAANG